jgi:WD40 repeat protein
MLATCSDDNTARLWDVRTGRELQKLKHDGPVSDVAFSSNKCKLVTGSADKTARLWDVQTGKEMLRLEHDGGVHAVAFSPDGSKLATSSYYNMARIWILSSKTLICEACSRLGYNLTTPEWRAQYCQGCD